MIPLVLDRKRHILVEGHPLGKAASEATDQPDKFGVYYHPVMQNFVLFRWEGPGVVQEYFTFKGLDEVTPEHLKFVQKVQSYRRLEEMRQGKNALLERPRDAARKQMDADREDKDRKDWVRKKLPINKRDCPSLNRFWFA